MKLRALAMSLTVTGLIAALPGVAMAHPVSGAFDGTYTSLDPSSVEVLTDLDQVDITRISDNVEFVASVPHAATSDMQFQRREGLQVWEGQVIDDTRDIVVMGGTGNIGLSTLDVTDPTNPELLAMVSCGGFHSDAGIWENFAIQTWDGSAVPCAPGDPANRLNVDRAPAEKGVRVFDITDPTDPVLVAFYGGTDGIPSGVHNLTINGEEGLVYLNMAEFNSVNPPWGFVDLNLLRDALTADDAQGVKDALTLKSIRDWSPSAADGCHDAGLAPGRDLFGCAGITASYIWDISDPRQPTEVAVIPNPGISIHHGARWTPDEMTLVLGDETAGAAAGTPEAVCTGGKQDNNPVGATWFYDATIPEAPVVTGTFSPTDMNGEFCTSHFYGFVRDTNLMVGGWYDAGIEIADYTPAVANVTGVPSSHAFFEPAESGFFSAYAYRGYVYGSSFEYGAAGKNRNSPGRGLWIIKVEGIDDVEPLAVDEGNSWGRWNSDLDSATYADGDVFDTGFPELVAAHTELPADLISVSLVIAGAGALLPRRRRRRS